MSNTATKTRRRDTKELAKELHSKVTEEVQTLKESEGWMRYLDVASSFHQYSFYNLMMILVQKPDATMISSFKRWQEMGRKVKKGEESIRIRGFRVQKVTEEDENGEEVERSIQRFPMVPVFDISQTEVREGEEDVLAAGNVPLLEGDAEEGLIDLLIDNLGKEGWSVSYDPDIRQNGITSLDGDRKVVIKEGLSDAHTVKTLIHETAHVRLHSEMNMQEYLEHRGIVEVEAESIAYVTAGLLGLDTSAYSVKYIAGWSRDEDHLKSTATRVIEVARAIYNDLTGSRVA